MHLDVPGERRLAQHCGERQAFEGAAAVVQFEALARSDQGMGHRQERGDADAAGEQQVTLAAEVQVEQVARGADGQCRTLCNVSVHAPGSAPGGRLVEHSNQVTAALMGGVAQRILAG